MAEIYVPGPVDIMGSANQMMQFRNSQQAQQENAMRMQFAMEDRARAEQARKVAAGNALAEQARKRELLDIYSNFGVTPAVTGQRGQSYSGAGVANDPYAAIQNELLRKGFAPQAGDIAELQNKNLTGEKTAAEIAGQKATNTGIDYKNTADFIKMTNAQIDAAPNLDALKAIVMATYTPGHPMAAFNKLNKLTPEIAIAGIDDLAAQGKTFDQIKAQMSQGATAAAKNFADLSLTEAQTAKTRGEGAAGTAKYKQDTSAAVQTLYEGVAKFGPDFVNTPEGRTAWAISQQPFTKEIEVNGVKTLVSVKPEPLVNISPPSNLSAVAGPKNNSYFGDVNQSPTNGVTTLIPNMGNVPKTESQIKTEAKVKGKSDVTQILGMLLKDYDSLEKIKAIPSEERTVAENIPAYLGATALGQEAGKAVGTKAQTLRTNVQSNARFLLTAIKNATGMSAQEMNSIPELQALQEAVTKPTQSIESVRDIIANVDKLYGTGGLKIEAAPKTEAPAKTEDKPKIAKLSDIEHTAKLKNLSVEEVKKRVRDLGMTIEGE